MNEPIRIPTLSGDYVTIFSPLGAPYRGPDGKELRCGQWYDTWVPNDHGFAQAPDGKWHLFGITHPLTSAASLHEGEVQLFHGEAPEDVFRGAIRVGAFVPRTNILPPGERPDEIKAIHSPFLVKRGNSYHMIYGPSPFRVAISEDLRRWELGGLLFEDADGGRDPQILFHGGIYYLCYCSGNEVRLRESVDLSDWSGARAICRMPETISPESPFLFFLEGTFYLFVCTWDDHWDHSTVSQAYQYKTLVYASSVPDDFLGREPVTTLEAHAPEIVEAEGRYFISSAEWPRRGINLAPLSFTFSDSKSDK